MKISLAVIVAISFVPPRTAFFLCSSSSKGFRAVALQSSTTAVDDDFANFEASLEQDDATTTTKTWQADLERLLDPTTPTSQRQILLSDLMGANAQIRSSVEAAIRDRKIDPLLTPTGQKIQDGTRAVARQLTNDILPSLSNNSGSVGSALPFPPLPKPADFSRLSGRVLNAVSNQLQQNLETIQGDLANPTRIPERISRQTEDLLTEAYNIFSETPVGLNEPPYTVVRTGDDYEIRDYAAYMVASTNLNADGDDVAEAGVAFNTLATYIFGANADRTVLDMTTPVTTTMSGEMRFFLSDSNPPDPLKDDASKTVFDVSKIRIERIPAARLAVRRFGGFCTAGEVRRQKQALLAGLALDQEKDDTIELDVAHGQTVGHVVFQYNPPYTLPVLRRNEIAVPIVAVDKQTKIEDSWVD